MHTIGIIWQAIQILVGIASSLYFGAYIVARGFYKGRPPQTINTNLYIKSDKKSKNTPVNSEANKEK